MTFKAWLTTPFEHTHENIAFNQLHDTLRHHWLQREDALHLLGNVYVDGYEIDAIIIKRNALIIIDFKDYGGEVNFSENGRWLIDSITVRGGNQSNPYLQIRKNKYQLLNYLNQRVSFEHSHNLGHIAGLCLFQKKIKFDANQLPPGIKRWFHITDFSDVYRFSNAIVSSEINFSDDEIKSILTALDLKLWHPDDMAEEISFPDYSPIHKAPIHLNNEQSQALALINEWLNNPNVPVFALSGAYGTGMSKVLEALLAQRPATNTYQRFLAPNARIARLHANHHHFEVNSIYSWLYSHVPKGLKEDIPHYPIDCVDANVISQSEQPLLVIFDSHLLGNEYFISETALYGSGYLLTDLLLTLKGEKQDGESRILPNILLLGDPYQLRRGAKDKNLLEGTLFKEMNISYGFFELKSQDLDKTTSVEQLSFQRELVGQLSAHKFLQLPVCTPKVFRTIVRGEHTAQIAEALLSSSSRSIYLCATHERAQSVNFSIRNKYLNARALGHLITGDRVETYTNTINLQPNEEGISQHHWLHAGVFATVKKPANNLFSKTIHLQGRDNPTVVDFATVTLEVGTGCFTVLYLPEFLISLKPEVSSDTLLALRIWAREEADIELSDEKAALEKLKENAKLYKGAFKSFDERKSQLSLDSITEFEEKNLTKLALADKSYQEAYQHYQNKHNELVLKSKFTFAARLRYAWALTVHRAQSHAPFQRVILDASVAHDTDNPATDSYFRWIYTASTRTECEMDLLQYPILTPLSKTQWNFSSPKIFPLVVRQRFHFIKDMLTEEDEASIALPEGFNSPTPELYALLLEVKKVIRPIGWHIASVTQHNYKERYVFQSDSKEVELDFNYNSKFEVTLGKCKILKGEAHLEYDLRKMFNKPLLWRDKTIHEAMSYFNKIIIEKGWHVIDGEEKPYKAFAILEHASGKVKLDINIPSESALSRKGIISSIHLVQADSESTYTQFKADFIHV